MRHILDATAVVAIFALIVLQIRCCRNKPTTVIEKVVTVEVKTPEYIRVSDTIYKDSLIYRRITLPPVTDSTVLAFLRDSINRLHMFIDAIAIREYNQSFRDSLQEVNVYSKTKGELIEQAIDYKIYSRTYSVDTVVQFNCLNISKQFVSIGAGYNPISNIPNLHVGYNYLSKKQNLFQGALTSDGQIYFKYGFLIRQPNNSN
jgi:hypothetical protein